MISKTRNSLTIHPLFADFFPPNIAAVVSTVEEDYRLHHSEEPFTDEQRKALLSDAGLDADRICNVKQVHGKRIIRFTDPILPLPEADGLMTGKFGLALAVRTADCLPVFLYDPDAPAVALVHAGWRGTLDRIAVAAVKTLGRLYGSKPERLWAAFGPCIRMNNYEVGAEFCDYFPDEVTMLSGRYHFDLALANRRQLRAQGVSVENIFDCGICTYSDAHFHSYRRDGNQAGRILSLIMIKE